MATEDLTTYTESDALNRLTETAARVTWTDLYRGDDQIYLYKDKGVDFFDGNFAHDITLKQTAGGGATRSIVGVWGLTNNLDDIFGITFTYETGFFLILQNTLSPTRRQLRIMEIQGRVQYSSPAFAITNGTAYYLRIVRNETGGQGYGTLKAFIYSDAGRTNLLGTISRDLLFSNKDFRYIQLATSWDFESGNDGSQSGYAEDLDLSAVIAVTPTVTTQAVTNIGESTATANGNITDLGTPNPTSHGFAYSPSDQTPDIETDSFTDEGAASSTGAFTSDLTGLTPGLLYYLRAYAKNDAGISYGSVVTVRGEKAIGAGWLYEEGPFIKFGAENGLLIVHNPPLTVSGSEDPGYLWTEATKLNHIDEAGDERAEEGTATGDTGPEGTLFIEDTGLHILDAAAGAERVHEGA